ncbi:MAG: hypothetical protein HC855_16550 [Rhizobiales bacterium]|nr:hypothetical protein [Hyphomicrobiales bacterium]
MASVGTSGNDVLNGPFVDFSQGGSDRVTGTADVNDAFFAGAALDPTDRINSGGAVGDQVVLSGDYSSGLTLNSTVLQNIGSVSFGAGFDLQNHVGQLECGCGTRFQSLFQ